MTMVLTIPCSTSVSRRVRVSEKADLRSSWLGTPLRPPPSTLYFPLRPRYPRVFIRSSSSSRASNSNSPVVGGSSAKVMDGKWAAKQVEEEIQVEVSRLKEATGIFPLLVAIHVGGTTSAFARNNKKACQSVGIKYIEFGMSKNCTEKELLYYISAFDNEPAFHAIFLELPLPKHMNEEAIVASIKKNVDRYPFRICKGEVVHLGKCHTDPVILPCSDRACVEMLHRYNIDMKDKFTVFIYRKKTQGQTLNIVGLPTPSTLAMPVGSGFTRHREEYSIRSHTYIDYSRKDPEEIKKLVGMADIIISAIGIANSIKGSWIQPGAVVIDLGLDRVKDATKSCGYRLVGDVCYDDAIKIASAITPVPGGIGPMTTTMLLANTLLLAAQDLHDLPY